MSEFEVNLNKLENSVTEFNTIKNEINSILDEIQTVENSLNNFSGSYLKTLKSKIKVLLSSVNNGKEDIASLSLSLQNIISIYRNSENTLTNGTSKNFNLILNVIIQRLRNILRNLFHNGGGDSSDNNEFDGDPVNVNNGNYVDRVEELSFPNGIKLSFERYYNSLYLQYGRMGFGWSHNYEIKIEVQDEELIVSWGNGFVEVFEKTDGDIYKSRFGSFDYIESSSDGFVYNKSAELKYHFDKSGNLIKITDLNGNFVSFTYNENDILIKAEDNFENFIEYEYNENNLLTGIKDSAERRVQMEYEGVSYLAEVVSASGITKKYSYNESDRLSAISDADNSVMFEIFYDESGRTTKQIFADRSEMNYSYDGNRITFEDRNCEKTTYVSDDKLRNIQTDYENGSETFVYNAKNQRIRFKDRMGFEFERNFDSNGNITYFKDALGYETNFEYNKLNKLVSKSDETGAVKYEYDDCGNVTKFTDTLGHITLMEYQQYGLLKKVIQADGSQINFEYDNKGNISSHINFDGGKTCFEYDAAGRMTKETDANGNITRFIYKNEKIDTVINPTGLERKYFYDKKMNLIKVIDFDGYEECKEYDILNRVIKSADKSGNVTQFEYDSRSNISKIIYPDGSFSANKYDLLNRLSETEFSNGMTIRYEYDKNGNCVSKDNGEFRQTFEYDALGRLTSFVDNNGQKVDVVLDSRGKVKEKTFSDNRKYVYEYDSEGNCISSIDGKGRKQTFEYGPLNKLTKATDNLNNVKEYSYYPGGALKSVLNPDGSGVEFEYDKNGNLLKRRYSTGHETVFAYDALDRIISVRQGDNVTTYEYDSSGNVSSEIDARGNQTKYNYSPINKLEQVTNSFGVATDYEFDAMGQLINIRSSESAFGDNDGYLIRYSRNDVGLIESIVYPNGVKQNYKYDKYGKVTEYTDEDNNVTNYKYSPSGMLTDVSYSDGNHAEYEYDGFGHIISAANESGKTKIVYDDFGKIVSIENDNGLILKNEWNDEGLKNKTVYPNGEEISYKYDNLNRIKAICGDAGFFEFEYDESGRLSKRKMPDDITESYSYNKSGSLESIDYVAQNKKCSLRYRYDEAGNRIEKTEITDSVSDSQFRTEYGYDKLNRIVYAKTGDDVTTFEYDDYGNLILKKQNGFEISYEYNGQNQLIYSSENGGTTYSYDNRGNMISVSDSEKELHFSYNAANKLEKVYDGNGKEKKYFYDAFGNLTKTISENGSHKNYIYSINEKAECELVAVYDGTDNRNIIRSNSVLGSLLNGKLSYYLNDELGSIKFRSDESGNISAQNKYDVFGLPSETELSDGEFGFTGLLYDSFGEFYHTGTRKYFPRICRFGSRDSNNYIRIKNPQSVNLYQYCLNNPVIYIDPNGTDCYIYYLPEWEHEAINDRNQLAREYGLDKSQVHLIKLTDNDSFTDSWNAMGTENGKKVDIDAVVINSHANPHVLAGGNFSIDASDVANLDNKDVGMLTLYGCNAGHADYADENMAAAFARKVNGAPVLASDGTVYSGSSFLNLTNRNYSSKADEHFRNWAESDRDNRGWLVYQYDGNSVEITEDYGKKYSITEMARKLKKVKKKEICPR